MTDIADMAARLRTQYASALKQFASSSKAFEVVGSVPAEPAPVTPKVLYVLDSSFNPPTLAHLRIASSALAENPGPSSRLLLLLATQNADKPSKPALFEDRLVMMDLFARDLRSALQGSAGSSTPDTLPQVDIGLTKKPYFIDKAAEIETSGVYPKSLEQVHLVGYDTLIRIFNPKYYPPTHTLQPLEPFLTQHRLRVTMRPDDEWGGRAEQEDYLRHLAQGGRESEGAKKEWAQRIQLVDGKGTDDRAVSSTRARQAAKSQVNDLDFLVTANVRDYIVSHELYKND